MDVRVNDYTRQMKETREHLESGKPDTLLGWKLDFSFRTNPEKEEYQTTLEKWDSDLREIYDKISEEVNRGCPSFETKAFLREATRLIDVYNKAFPEIKELLDNNQPPMGDSVTTFIGEFKPSTMTALLAWYYIADFCGEVIRIFTPLIDHCRQTTPQPDEHTPNKGKTPKPDYKTLRGLFKEGTDVWFDQKLMPLLEDTKTKQHKERNKKDAAGVALAIYESGYLKVRPGTFSEWNETFCRLAGYRYGKSYNPAKAKLSNAYEPAIKNLELVTKSK